MELNWPLLKKSTQANYEFFFSSYLIPKFGDRKIVELNTMEFQAFFNSLIGKISPYTICNMNAALRAALTQAETWDLIERNTAIGVKLPKKKPSKPNQLLSFPQIKAVIEHLPEPTNTIVTLIVFGSMRVGEALALRWNDILEDCIVIDERLYDGDLDDPKTLHGNREVPFDGLGVMKSAISRIWQEAKHRKPDDFVFATRSGTPTERRNVLRHLKATAKELEIPRSIDFRSFRTMHASLMRRSGARPEVARDNMGHSEIQMTLEGYSRTWWDERANAVSAVVNMVMNSDATDDSNQQHMEKGVRHMPFQTEPEECLSGAPSGAPCTKSGACSTCRIDCKLLILMVGERGFEPPTPWSRTRCSTRLSHSPNTVDSASKGRGLARSFPSLRSLKCNRIRALRAPVAHALRKAYRLKNDGSGHGAQVK